jgi:hypothetical protein
MRGSGGAGWDDGAGGDGAGDDGDEEDDDSTSAQNITRAAADAGDSGRGLSGGGAG